MRCSDRLLSDLRGSSCSRRRLEGPISRPVHRRGRPSSATRSPSFETMSPSLSLSPSAGTASIGGSRIRLSCKRRRTNSAVRMHLCDFAAKLFIYLFTFEDVFGELINTRGIFSWFIMLLRESLDTFLSIKSFMFHGFMHLISVIFLLSFR